MNTSKIVSNVAYHGELERKKQMEERRTMRADDNDSPTDSSERSSAYVHQNNQRSPYHADNHQQHMQQHKLMHQSSVAAPAPQHQLVLQQQRSLQQHPISHKRLDIKCGSPSRYPAQ
ncbi:hypothetical protein GZH46_02140, partial [Fragariocoptes setiger]